MKQVSSNKKIDFIFRYDNKEIDYSIWLTAITGGTPTILFLGTVQIANIPEWVAADCPPDTIVVQGAPHWFAKEDGTNIPQYMSAFTEVVFEQILNIIAPKQVNIIAESQGVPSVLTLLSKYQFASIVKNLVLIQPLGLNSDVYYGDTTQRIKIFRKRIISNTRHQLKPLILEKKLRYNHRLVNKMIGINSAKAKAQYDSGLAYDAVTELKNIYRSNKNIFIICGENDKLFPPAEIQSNLFKHDIPIQVETINSVPHSPLATKYGQRLLARAFEKITSQSN